MFSQHLLFNQSIFEPFLYFIDTQRKRIYTEEIFSLAWLARLYSP